MTSNATIVGRIYSGEREILLSEECTWIAQGDELLPVAKALNSLRLGTRGRGEPIGTCLMQAAAELGWEYERLIPAPVEDPSLVH